MPRHPQAVLAREGQAVHAWEIAACDVVYLTSNRELRYGTAVDLLSLKETQRASTCRRSCCAYRWKGGYWLLEQKGLLKHLQQHSRHRTLGDIHNTAVSAPSASLRGFRMVAANRPTANKSRSKTVCKCAKGSLCIDLYTVPVVGVDKLTLLPYLYISLHKQHLRPPAIDCPY